MSRFPLWINFLPGSPNQTPFMEQNPPSTNANSAVPNGTLPHVTESFGAVPSDSARFGTVRNDSEPFGSVPTRSERSENHTLTVREVARMFEIAGVARTERSIVKWCRRVGHEVPRLDSYFDPNERKHYITPESVERAIAEEQAKAAKINARSEPVGTVPNASAPVGRDTKTADTGTNRVPELEKEVMDLKITNRAKDFFIEQLKQERDGFANERKEFVAQLVSANRRVGELENQLLQLAEPGDDRPRKLEVRQASPVRDQG